VAKETIKHCWIKSTLFQQPDSIESLDNIDERIELQACIQRLPIENPLPIDEFLNPEHDVVVDGDEDIFESVVDCYRVDKLGVVEESSDEEVEVVDVVTALKSIETVRLWTLQKGNSQDLQSIDRIERDMLQCKSSMNHQTTILRFFRPN